MRVLCWPRVAQLVGFQRTRAHRLLCLVCKLSQLSFCVTMQNPQWASPLLHACGAVRESVQGEQGSSSSLFPSGTGKDDAGAGDGGVSHPAPCRTVTTAFRGLLRVTEQRRSDVRAAWVREEAWFARHIDAGQGTLLRGGEETKPRSERRGGCFGEGCREN